MQRCCVPSGEPEWPAPGTIEWKMASIEVPEIPPYAAEVFGPDVVSGAEEVFDPDVWWQLVWDHPELLAYADEDFDLEKALDPDHRWRVVVWADPVNLMCYVVYVFRKLCGFAKVKATAVMLQVHHEKRAVVLRARREQAEFDCLQLQSHGLWATVEP